MEDTIKMETKEQVATRARLYDAITEKLTSLGMDTETIKGGRLIDLGNGFFARVQVSICDVEKVPEYRAEYAEQLQKDAEKAIEKARKADEKAAKAAERAAKKTAPAAE